MRRLLILSLALLLMFSLVACGGESGGSEAPGNTDPPEGYDAEYTIVIDGADSWRPFENGSGVTFASSKGGVISSTDDGKTVKFTGLAVGETDITATSGTDTAKALVKVVKRSEQQDEQKAKFSGTYAYNPPTDNFCIETQSTRNGKSETDVWAKIGDEEANIDGDDWQGFYNVSTGANYTVLDGRWIEDVQWGFHSIADRGGVPSPLDTFNTFFQLLQKLGFGNEKLGDFYIGEETICGVKCWVFDTNGYNAIYAKYWVDPANGCTLKEAGTTEDYVCEVTTYDLDYTAWDASLAVN